jgi:hypothetical protein
VHEGPAEDQGGDSPCAELASAGSNGIQKLKPVHEALLDLIIAHPDWKQRQYAHSLGYSQGWMSQILASEAFRKALAKRRDEVIDPVIKASLSERFEANVRLALNLISRRLHSKDVSDNFILRVAEMGSRALGLEAAPQSPVDLKIHLHAMSESLVKLLREKRRVIESESLQ